MARSSKGPCCLCRWILLAAAAIALTAPAAAVRACTSTQPPLRLDSSADHQQLLQLSPVSLHDDEQRQASHLLARSPQSPAPGSGITLGGGAGTGTSGTSADGLPAGYAMPQPFDAILGVNFTSTSCPAFFTSFLSNAAFKACAPLSLLLETSTSFFKTMQDSTLLSPVMDQICRADADSCIGVMDNYATLIAQDSNCGRDLAKGNALAVSALNGLRNYELYYRSGCLKSAKTDQYCIAEAANATTPSDLYIYYLPGGTSLPSGEKPTCSDCSQSVMGIFSNYATNSTLRISATYVNARNVIALSCGPSFAPMIAATTTGTGTAASVHGSAPWLSVFLASSLLLGWLAML